MSAEADARRIATEVMQDFRKMFPGNLLLDEEARYLAALIVAQVREALAEIEDDGR